MTTQACAGSPAKPWRNPHWPAMRHDCRRVHGRRSPMPDASHLPGPLSHANRSHLSRSELHPCRANLPYAAGDYLSNSCLHAKRPELSDDTPCNVQWSELSHYRRCNLQRSELPDYSRHDLLRTALPNSPQHWWWPWCPHGHRAPHAPRRIARVAGQIAQQRRARPVPPQVARLAGQIAKQCRR